MKNILQLIPQVETFPPSPQPIPTEQIAQLGVIPLEARPGTCDAPVGATRWVARLRRQNKEVSTATAVQMPATQQAAQLPHEIPSPSLKPTGKPFTEGEVKVKVYGPDKAARVKDVVGMNNGFCAEFDLLKKGKYGVMTNFQLKGGEVQSVKFWYDVR